MAPNTRKKNKIEVFTDSVDIVSVVKQPPANIKGISSKINSKKGQYQAKITGLASINEIELNLGRFKNNIVGGKEGGYTSNLTEKPTVHIKIRNGSFGEKVSPTCDCETVALANEPSWLRGSLFYGFTSVGGSLQTLNLSKKDFENSVCGLKDWCLNFGSLNSTFTDTKTKEVITFPQNSLILKENDFELTLIPSSNADQVDHSLTMAIPLQYHFSFSQGQNFSFKITSNSTSRLKGRKLQSVSVTSGYCSGSTGNLNLLNSNVLARQSKGHSSYNTNANQGCDGVIQFYNPIFSTTKLVWVYAPGPYYWVVEFQTSVWVQTILYIEWAYTSNMQSRVGEDNSNNYLNNPMCIGGQQTAGGWLDCALSGKYFAMTSALSLFDFMEVMLYSQEAIHIKAKSSTLSSTLTSVTPYKCITGTNCQAYNVLRKQLVTQNNQPGTTDCCIYTTPQTDPALTVTFNADILIDIVICIPSDQSSSSVTAWQTNIEVWISNATGVLQLCGTLTDYNTYKEVPCNKIGNKIIVKRPGTGMTLAMAGFSALSSCDCSKTSFDPSLISLPVVIFASATTLIGTSIDTPKTITFNTQILDTVSSVCGPADGFTKCGLRSSISFVDKSTGLPITVWPYLGYNWDSASSSLALNFAQAVAKSVLTATLSLTNFPTVIWSQDITSNVSTAPSTPTAPATSVNLSTGITIAWNAPSNGGSAIIAYTVQIRRSDGGFSTELVTCNGSNSATVSALSCAIPITTLQAAPFKIVGGASIYATVIATNVLGSSNVSNAGNGAVMPQDCSASSMSVSVVRAYGDLSYVPEKSNAQFVITWADFLLKQNTGCTKATVKYGVTVSSISGLIDSKWFSFDLVQRKIFFNILAPFTDSKLKIEITGRINGDLSLASAVDKFTFSVIKSQNQESQPIQGNNSQADVVSSNADTAVAETVVTQIDSAAAASLVKWVPPEQKQKQAGSLQQKIVVPLTAQIQSIDSKGQVKIGFSKLIMTPDQFRNLTVRQKAGNYTETIQNLISVKVDPYLTDSDLYKIKSVNLIEFSSSYIVLNVTFEHPNSITTEVRTPDFLAAQILNTDYFIGLQDYDRVKNDTAMTKELPPQLTAVQQKKIEKLEKTVSSGFTFVASTNIVLNIFLASGLKYFWGMINVLQFLVFMTRWKLNYPPNALSALNFIKMIALMEFLPTGWFTDILSDWFSIEKGDESNIVENMGMMLLIGCTVLLAVLLMIVVFLVVLCNYKMYRAFRMVHRKVFYNTFIRYVLQSTLKMQIASITTITLKTWDQGNTQILIAGTVIAVLSVMPFVFIGVLLRNFKSLGKPSMIEKIGSLYTGLKTGEKWSTVAYSFIFLIRRQIFVAMTFLMVEQPSLQVHLFIYMLLWYVIYIESVLPHETRFLTTQEHVNEIFMLLICYHFVLFTGIVSNIEMRDYIGWSLNGCICIMIAFNLVILIAVSMRTFMRKIKLWKLKRKQAQAIKESNKPLQALRPAPQLIDAIVAPKKNNAPKQTEDQIIKAIQTYSNEDLCKYLRKLALEREKEDAQQLAEKIVPRQVEMVALKTKKPVITQNIQDSQLVFTNVAPQRVSSIQQTVPRILPAPKKDMSAKQPSISTINGRLRSNDWQEQSFSDVLESVDVVFIKERAIPPTLEQMIDDLNKRWPDAVAQRKR